MSRSFPTQDVDLFDPFAPSNIQEPFPFFAKLRETQPVYWNPRYSFWMLSRYQDVKKALLSPTAFLSSTGVEVERRAENLPQSLRADFDICYRFWYTVLLTFDQRNAVMKAFAPRGIGEMEGSITRRVERLLDKLEHANEFDFVAQFAYPLPSLVIFDLLGLPPEYHHVIRESAAAIVTFPSLVFRGEFAQFEQVAEALRQAARVLNALIRQRRASPTGDLISTLVHESDAKVRLSDDEIVVLCNFLLTAGHETTANLLSGSLRYLLQNRSLWNQLREAPGLIGNAIEELLRFVSPVLWVSRLVAEDIEVAGHVLRKGSRVQLGIGAANHDPSEFTDPETLDLARPKAHSLAFGYGPHFCIGATLARLETKIALSRLLRRASGIRLISDVFEYQPHFFLRTLKTLRVAL
jgi:cytochrome P450